MKMRIITTSPYHSRNIPAARI